jgi:hypothetical protein
MSGRVFAGSLEPKFNPFDEDYLAEILEVTAIAWNRMPHPPGSEIEDRITNRLAGWLANDPRFADLPYDIIAQCCLLGLNGEQLGRLDLRFKHRHSQRDYFAFESKRLHVTYPGGQFRSEYTAYAGDDGMMAFVAGEYAKGLPAGGMLGYVMDGNADVAWGGLRSHIEAQRLSLRLMADSRLARSSLSAAVAKGMDGTHLGETEHDLATHQLRLFHLLLPVRYGHAGTTFTKGGPPHE